MRWRRVRAALLASSPLDLSIDVPVRASLSLLEPGVVGVFRQVLTVPRGIQDHLSAVELEAVLAHELCHLRRRDNLTAAIHMLVQALFWFHPLVWWIGGRLIAERERACDEGVIGAGHDPRVYAESILKVCRFYLQAPLACAVGVSGSNLKKRMELIMTGSPGAPMGVRKTLMVSAAAVLAVAAPLAAGLAAAVPAAAGTALLDKAGPPPGPQAADGPAAGSDPEGPAPAPQIPPSRTLAQALEQGARTLASPGEAIAAAAHVDAIEAPRMSLAALAPPQLPIDAAGAPQDAASPPAAGCRLPVLATLRVDPRSYVPLVDGEINGRKVQFIAAVSSHTAIFRSAAKALDVFEEAGRERVNYSAGGVTEIGRGWVRDLELDDMPRDVLSSYDVHENFHVSMMDGGVSGTSNPSAMLGAQFWALADDDFDLRANTISLVRPVGCAPADPLPFNGGAYSQTRLLTPPNIEIDYRVAVIVDGVPLEAEIDTGSTTSVMTWQGAFKLSHGRPLPDTQAQGPSAAGGPPNILWSKARFKTFSIGQETIQNPRIAVADIYGCAQETKARWMRGDYPHPGVSCRLQAKVPDMILGADFFRAHHVLISNSRRMVYFVYNGAPIFQ